MAFILCHDARCDQCKKDTEVKYKIIMVDNREYFTCSFLCAYRFKIRKKINEKNFRINSLIRR